MRKATRGRRAPLRSYLTPSIADLFFVTILFTLFFTKKSGLLGDGDTGFHIRTGDYILSTGSIPKIDIFSYHTPPLSWTAHEWLSEVVMAAVHGVSGLTGIVAFFSVILALTIYLLFKILTIHGNNILIAAGVTVAVFMTAWMHWLARPHVFSFLFMIVFQYLLESWHCDRKNRLYLLAPLMLLWVNMHGGFVGGFILIGAYLLGSLMALTAAPPEERPALIRKAKGLVLATVACVAACLVNPQGYRILLFPFRLVSDSFIMDHVSEFLSPNFHNPMPFKYLLLVSIGIFAFSRKKMEATEFVLLLIFTNMALYSARYIPLFALVMAPALTRHAVHLNNQRIGRVAHLLRNRADSVARVDDTLRGHLWPAAAVLVVVGSMFCGRVTHAFDDGVKCVKACEFLMREKVGGRVFNNDEFGDYLIYRGQRRYQVFIDGRLDMYGSSKMKEYFQVVRFEKGWERVLERYGITWIFYDTNSSLSRFLMHDRRWVLIYSDKVASIFVMDLPQYQELIRKYRRSELAAVVDKEHPDHL